MHESSNSVSSVNGGEITTPETFVISAFSSLNSSSAEPSVASGLPMTQLFIPRVTHPRVDVAFSATSRGFATITIDVTFIFTSHRAEAV